MSSSKRTTTASSAPKPPTLLAPTTTISDTASLTGSKLITIRGDTIIHPRGKLISSNAPVTIGSGCIISERSVVGLQTPAADQPEGVVLEDHVVIEVGAIVEAKRVGEGSIIEINAKVGQGATVGKHCTVGPLCTVEENEVIPDYTVIYGAGMRRLDNSGVDDLKIKMVKRQVEVLKKLIPSNLARFH